MTSGSALLDQIIAESLVRHPAPRITYVKRAQKHKETPPSPLPPPPPPLQRLAFDECPSSIRVRRIQSAISQYFIVSREEIMSRCRIPRISLPRQIGMYLCRQLTHLSFPQIGKFFGGRDHTTVLHSYRKIAELVDSDMAIADSVAALKEMLK